MCGLSGTAGTNYLYTNDKALLWIVKRGYDKRLRQSAQGASIFFEIAGFVFYLMARGESKEGAGDDDGETYGGSLSGRWANGHCAGGGAGRQAAGQGFILFRRTRRRLAAVHESVRL